MPDTLLEVSAACDTLAAHLTEILMRNEPGLFAQMARGVISAELFACAQDMQRLFAPLSDGEQAAVPSSMRRMRDEGIA